MSRPARSPKVSKTICETTVCGGKKRGIVARCWEDVDVANKRKKRRRRGGTTPRPSKDRTGGQLGTDPSSHDRGEPDNESVGNSDLEASWDASRSGARSGRGYRFQDTVGALLAAQLAAGHIQANAVVPEGHEDVSLEGTTPWHIQIKSRGRQSGEFPAHEATDHILTVWKSHLARNEPGAQLGVVFERDIKGEQLSSCLHGPGVTTGKSLPEDSKLLQSLRNKGKASGISDADIDALLSSTMFAVFPWDAVMEETLDCLKELDGLSTLAPSSLRHIALLLCVEIGDASNENASRAHGDRRALSRTEIVGNIHEFASKLTWTQWKPQSETESVSPLT